MFVSVTRLRLRSWRYLPAFFFHALRSARQAKRAAGFISGYLAGDVERGSWTVTGWESEAAMRAYRNSAAHRAAMPTLLQWCDEGSFAHWTQDDEVLPDPLAAFERMQREGRTSKVQYPSARHLSGGVTGSAEPRPGTRLHPARRRSGDG
jgi:heme-degrading monooxygenase HmoA